MIEIASYELEEKSHRLLFINIPRHNTTDYLEFFSLCNIMIYRKVKCFPLKILKGDKND